MAFSVWLCFQPYDKYNTDGRFEGPPVDRTLSHDCALLFDPNVPSFLSLGALALVLFGLAFPGVLVLSWGSAATWRGRLRMALLGGFALVSSTVTCMLIFDSGLYFLSNAHPHYTLFVYIIPLYEAVAGSLAIFRALKPFGHFF